MVKKGRLVIRPYFSRARSPRNSSGDYYMWMQAGEASEAFMGVGLSTR
jgi:hypothetical protein